MKPTRSIVFSLLILSLQSLHPQNGNAGFQFLKIGVGGRACGMGEAYSSIVDDASSVYWNPAGLSLSNKKEILFMHNEWLLDTKFEFLAGKLPISDCLSLGLGFSYLNYGDIEGRNEYGYRLPDYSAYDFAFSISLAARVLKSLHAGFTQKMIQSRIENERGVDFVYDGGVLYQLPIKGLNTGFVCQNLGNGCKFIEEVTEAPIIIKGGISYAFALKSTIITPTVDLLKEIKNDYRINTGVEFNLIESFALRCGYKSGCSQGGMTAGLGFSHDFPFSTINIDYAYGNHGYLDSVHRLSLGLKL